MSQPLPVAGIYLEDRAPTVAEFTTLIQAVGWERYTNLDVIGQALANSLFCTLAMQAGRAVSMGRLVGDGVRFVYVQDVAVLPDFQKQGVGTMIMDRLMRHISETAPNQSTFTCSPILKPRLFMRGTASRAARIRFAGCR